MSDSSQEPTMEEILASIRRIISEDDAPEGDKSAAPPHGDEPPTAEAASAEAPLEEVEEEAFDIGADDELELTEKVESHGDLEVYSAEPEPEPATVYQPEPEPAPAPAAFAAPEPDIAALVSAPAAAAAAAAFGKLSGSMAMPAPGRTLEDVVRELLRPMLQQWCDENLPGIVQRAVDAEVARIARGG